MDNTTIATLSGAAITIISNILTYLGTREKYLSRNKPIFESEKLTFETTDYVKHLRTHKIPVDSARHSFMSSNSIDDLSTKLRSLLIEDTGCEYFDPEKMKTIYLFSINNARTALDLKPFVT